MHGLTQKEKIAGYDDLQAAEWRNGAAVSALYQGTVMWSKWVKEPDSAGKYRVGLFDHKSCTGGYCITAFEYPNQRPQLTVIGWEDFQRRISEHCGGSVYGTVMASCIADLRNKIYVAENPETDQEQAA